MQKEKIKKVARKTIKILLWIIGSIIGLFLLLVIALQIPVVQNFAKDKAISFLQTKIDTKVSVGRIEIGLPKNIILEEVYFEDQQKDTLLYGNKIVANISLFKLLSNELEINSVNLNGITANVTKTKEGIFNFDYILDAFASKEPPKKDQKPMKISVSKIVLDDINVVFNDAVSKNDFSVKLKHFDTKVKKFDLDNLAFDVPKIKIDGLKLQLNQGLAEATTKSTKAIKEEVNNRAFSIINEHTALTDIDVTYKQENSKFDTRIKLKELKVDFKEIDLMHQKIKIKKLYLNETEGTVFLGKNEQQNISNQKEEKSGNSSWEIEAESVKLTKIDFKFDDDSRKKSLKGIDYSHLDLTDFNLDANNIKYSSTLSSGKLNSFSVNDKSGLIVEDLKTDFYYSSSVAYLKNLYFKTPKTEIKDELVANYTNIKTLGKDLDQLSVKASLENSEIAVSDILIFVPELENTKPFSSNKNAILKIDGLVYGKLNNLNIPNLEVSGIGSTYASISGTIKGLPKAKDAYYDITIKNIRTTSNDIYSLVPNGTIPETIQLPKQIATKGTFKGKISDFDVNLLVNSSMGNAKVEGNFDQTIKDSEKYNAKAWLDEFDLGALLKNESLGKFSVQADVKGYGLNPKTANATINSTITKAEFNKYAYQDITINGKLQNGLYDAKIDSNDENLKFNLVSNGGFQGKYPSLKLRLNLDIADLRKLNLHAGYLKIKGDVDADFDQLDFDNLNGKLSITNTLVALETEQFPLDSLNLIAVNTPEKNSIKLSSQFVNVNLDGKFKLSQVQNALMNSISNYYDLNAKKTAVTEPQQLNFKIQLKDEPLVMKIIPGLKNMSAILVEGKYNSENDTIQVNASIPKLDYNGNVITNASLKINKEENALVYNFIVDDLKNASLQLPYTNISGKVEDNTIDYVLQLKDIKDVERYLLSGTLKNVDGNSEVAFINDKLKLNYENWNIDDNNIIKIGKNGVYINDFILTNNANQFSVKSESEKPNAPIDVDFKDFDLKTLTNIVESDFEFGGKINGTTQITNLNSSPIFIADLDIENFAVKNDTVGNLKIKIDNKIASVYNASVEISGFDNLVNLDGNYKVGTGTFDLKLNIDHFKMKSIQAFTFGNLKNSTGFMNGKLDITGSTKQPNVLGFLKFNEVGFEVKTLSSKFKLLNDKIDFTNQKILFTNFKLQDENNNNLVLDGSVNSADFTNLGLDLSLIANNFNPINSTEKDNDLFYGELYLDNDIRIKGTLNSPIIDGSIKINKDTKFSVVLPQTKPSIADREGVVEFIDQDQPILYDQSKDTEKFNQSAVTGIEASVNIEVDKDAEISIVIDKANGDFLKLKGEAELTGGIDASGKTSLTGKYEFTEGSYEMNFNMIKRKFDIKPGSYILWKGEPTSADVHVVAIYKADVAPIDLVADQLGAVTPEVRNTYKQKIPFETELKMDGELLKPKITFDIILPEGNNSVSAEVINTTKAKLNQIRLQEDALNKQVFALLLLGRFIGENPFESEVGGFSASSLARQSASKILSQQLNNLAGDLISGVELDFDLQATEDYTSGTKENRTDLKVGLSKKLLNDRLKVTIGSNIGLEGTPRENEETSKIAGDLSADYMLSKDGRYKLRAYRKNNYQVALQGQVIETGVAFIITMDYDVFSELFHRTKKNK
ncbi:translocation/assembly module TamB domain-containing protein [Flavobacterium ardleyense]|uniref:Translocation/assembly module TamB domain-containing protein n=1 Tax=Flavobacterium ardleyense TaxID=2038737 RepID=A0ABW5Z4R8_9FLAO